MSLLTEIRNYKKNHKYFPEYPPISLHILKYTASRKSKLFHLQSLFCRPLLCTARGSRTVVTPGRDCVLLTKFGGNFHFV